MVRLSLSLVFLFCKGTNEAIHSFMRRSSDHVWSLCVMVKYKTADSRLVSRSDLSEKLMLRLMALYRSLQASRAGWGTWAYTLVTWVIKALHLTSGGEGVVRYHDGRGARVQDPPPPGPFPASAPNSGRSVAFPPLRSMIIACDFLRYWLRIRNACIGI